MIKKILKYLKHFDWLLFFSILLLTAFGLIEIYSIALGQGGANMAFFHKQTIFIVLGILLLFILSFLDYHLWRNSAIYFYLFNIVLLVAVLFFGQTVRGTRGWFEIGGFGIQPVELVKFGLIIFLARYFSQTEERSLKQFLLSGLGFFILFGLVLAQPDFGSAMILFLTWIFMLIVAGFSWRYFVVIAVLGVLLLASGWLFYFAPYQKQRIKTFFNPSFDPLNQGYNVAQAIIAIGAGRLHGRGVGFGSQTQLKFLPEAHNDFIFAVIAEELGFLGVSLVILFFSVFFIRCLFYLRRSKDRFGAYFVAGAASLIFIQMFINMSMNIGLLPVVGISLPFISYGGSALLVNMVMAGVIESVIIRSKIKY